MIANLIRCRLQEKDQLMSVLRPLIYDPLVEWSKTDTGGAKRKSKNQSSDSGEVTSDLAITHIKNIEERLGSSSAADSGEDRGLSLSIEGRIQDLIHDATDEKNLARMYAGWSAYV